MGDRRESSRADSPRSENAALIASGWVGVLFVAAGAIGRYLAPGALLLWAVLIVFGVTAMPMALRAPWRKPPGRGRGSR